MKTVQLEWKSFNVNLVQVEAMARTLDPSCCGCSADSSFKVHFTNDALPDAIVAELESYWDSITETSSEATSYQSAAQIATATASAKAANLASAQTKLEALGLTTAEIAAILGQ